MHRTVRTRNTIIAGILASLMLMVGCREEMKIDKPMSWTCEPMNRSLPKGIQTVLFDLPMRPHIRS
jgi:hypothetical protein